jgi:hypothetical protein
LFYKNNTDKLITIKTIITMRNFFLTMVLFTPLLGYSQVGVNTQNPQGIFHIDVAKDNPSSASPSLTQQSNDVLVNNEGNLGIGTTIPTNKLHIVGTNPLRLEGLQASFGTVGSLTVNSTVVVQLRSSSSISAAKGTGSVTITANNTFVNTAISTKTFDNLNEMTGNTFTASSTGLYKVNLIISYPQRASSEDGGDGYLGFARISLNGIQQSFTSPKLLYLKRLEVYHLLPVPTLR